MFYFCLSPGREIDPRAVLGTGLARWQQIASQINWYLLTTKGSEYGKRFLLNNIQNNNKQGSFRRK